MMEFINTYFINPANTFIWSYLLFVTLIPLAIYFTFQSRFVQFRLFTHMFKVISEGTKKVTKNGQKSISPFQAFCIGCASRIGTGNIVGIAIALTVGGPGAIFWMWMLALFGAATAFVECTLAQIYKVKQGPAYRGGPAYYMQCGMKKRWMGILFSILLIGCVGFIFASVHTNAIVSSFDKAFGINPVIGGIVIAFVTSLVIFGGVRRIATVTEFLVPIMAVIYLCVTGYILVTNINMIPYVFSLIVKSAFGFTQFAGGLAGITVQIIMRTGISRGLFSNEAGQGTAPNAAGTAETSHPVKQGLIQAMGVFFDTLIICSATAFVIILAGAYNSGIHEGVQLTQESISYFVGSWGHIFVAVSILLFAFSSIIGNYYYGETNLLFITEKKKYLFAYRFTLILWILFGSIVNVSQIWNLADFAMGLMTVVNLIALVCLGKFAMQALDHYQYHLKEGKNPVFYKNSLDNPGDIECWNNDDNDMETKTVKEIYELESLATTRTTTTTS